MSHSLFNIAVRYQSQIQQWMETISEDLHPSQQDDEDLVRRASFSVRNGAVRILSYDPYEHELEAKVQDVTPVMVTVSLVEEQVTCSCPDKSLCRHSLAVIFSLYMQKFSLSEWLQEWRLKKSEQLSLLANKRTPRSWDAIVQSTFNAVSGEWSWKERYYIDNSINQMKQKLKKFMPFEREWQPLYVVYTRTVLIRLLFEVSSDMDPNLFRATIQTDIEDMQHQLMILSSKPRLFAADPFYDALVSQVRHIVYELEVMPDLRFNLFHAFWVILFTEKGRRESEFAYLEEQKSFDNELFRALFCVLLKQPEELRAITDKIQATDMPEWMHLAKLAKEQDDLLSLTIILHAMRPHIFEYVNTYLSAWNRSVFVSKLYELYKSIDMPDDEREQLFWQFGSFGVRAYSDFLIDQQRFSDWVALHHRFGSTLDYAESCGMKTVIQEAPETVLPLYHVLALKEVRERSRHNYKQAVRIWKKMKLAAKKGGKTDYWNSYVNEIQAKYRRLRALQEEILKGNLPL
ncbi:SWIM zinc finger family protein [Paenisporosarcina indica]|uniref:SWIM zinc finger family protein n=1 Tax=Paenisporosarcina indica TaxID=650093 RepID=UPI00094F543D|nr:SWIM zinc finger family protein [Paenisporosarcina indica]